MAVSKLFGIHSVQAALDYSPKNIQAAWVDKQRQDKRLQKVSGELADLGIKLQAVDRKQLDKLSARGNHQGILIEVIMPQVRCEADLKQAVLEIETVPFFLVLDHVQDPHNLGACLRSADATKVDGIIITKDQATGITPTVCKVASGAAETVPVYQVTNLARTLRWLKSQNIWVIGTASEAEQTLYQTDMTLPLVLVVGAEGEGMRRLTREQCDLLVKLPMLGQVESLNLSVASGVLLYEVVRQRVIATV